MRKNRVSRKFRDTPAENRKMDEWARKLEAEGFRSIGMVKLPRRKGENYLHSPIRWKYTFERREEAQTGVMTPGSAEEVLE